MIKNKLAINHSANFMIMLYNLVVRQIRDFFIL